MQEDAIIVYRRDFYRKGESTRTVNNSKVFKDNMKHRNAPNKCWNCIHFGMCKMKNPEDCTGDTHTNTESKI